MNLIVILLLGLQNVDLAPDKGSVATRIVVSDGFGRLLGERGTVVVTRVADNIDVKRYSNASIVTVDLEPGQYRFSFTERLWRPVTRLATISKSQSLVYLVTEPYGPAGLLPALGDFTLRVDASSLPCGIEPPFEARIKGVYYDVAESTFATLVPFATFEHLKMGAYVVLLSKDSSIRLIKLVALTQNNQREVLRGSTCISTDAIQLPGELSR